MKARIIVDYGIYHPKDGLKPMDGETVTIIGQTDGAATLNTGGIAFCCVLKDGMIVHIQDSWLQILPDEPEILTTSFDWESFRNETAAKAMQAFLSNQEMAERLEQNGEFFHDLASDSIGLADELINQLKKPTPC